MQRLQPRRVANLLLRPSWASTVIDIAFTHFWKFALCTLVAATYEITDTIGKGINGRYPPLAQEARRSIIIGALSAPAATALFLLLDVQILRELRTFFEPYFITGNLVVFFACGCALHAGDVVTRLEGH